ncbi:hypothetical protein MMC07_002240 [Pseudocyphellaria aurata]|nr:hypothetical protein [Pseudocyphellaria aurata]
MKQRFSSLDVKVIAHELSHALCTLRLANVYDLSSRIFLLKFAKPDHRQQLIVESGFRCHLTSFTRATATAPSAFVTKLRKYLRTRRVTSVSQLGTDRIIELQFSDGQYHLFLEFYAGGNIVLTDKDLVVLGLLRIVGAGADQEELRVGLKYSLSNRQNYNGVPDLTEERLRHGLQKAVDKVDGDIMASKKLKKKSGDALRKALASSLNEFPPVLLDHALRVAHFDPSTGVEEVLKNADLLHRLMLVLEEAKRVIDGIMSITNPKGYIIAKTLAVPIADSKDRRDFEQSSDLVTNERVLYEDYHPFRPQQFEKNTDFNVLEFDGFNKAVDEFYSSIEGQKLESRLSEREKNAEKKLDAAKQDHIKRLGGLQQVQEMHVRKAQAIEANLQKVQEAVAAINSLIAQGMDWVELARLIEMEQARNNPVAQMIKLPLKLYENTATLFLEEAHFDDEEDFEGNETDSDVSESGDEGAQRMKPKSTATPETRLSVDIDLALSPWSNARQYYDQKKVAAVKEQKTLQSSEKALKSTEKKISADLKKGLKQEKQVLRPVRQQLWFEKFIFFISSESYLVLGGRDAQQNEILYNRYLKRGDIYVHADLQGAASVIIKNTRGRPDDPIPPSTLSQAGTLAVSTSIAWESKAVMAAWWVNADQVSKTSPSGEYLATGSFAIRGQKNFLPPAQLILGFGAMFRVSEKSKARHLKHRLRDTVATNKLNSEGEKHSSLSSPAEIEESNEIDDEADHSDSPVDLESEHEDNPAEMPTIREPSVDDEDEHGSDLEYHNPLQPKVEISDSPYSPLSENAATAGHVSHISEASSNAGSDDEFSQAGETEVVLGEEEQLVEYDKDVTSSDRQNTRDGSTSHQDTLAQSTKDIGSNDDSDQPITPPSLSNSSTPASKLSESIGGSVKPNPHVRGKRGKYNKIKTKYANQDDEDRALAMRLLGSSAAHDKAREETAAKKLREQHLAEQKQRRQQHHAIAAEKGKAMEKMRQIQFEGGVDTPDEDTGEGSVVDLEAFVGSVMPGDEVLDALVMCGPWDAVGGRCAWRAKLQPGTTKKGKAVREILTRWTAVVADREKKKKRPAVSAAAAAAGENDHEAMKEEEQLWRREGALLRNIRDQEVVGVVPVGKCRVVMSGSGGGGEAGGAKGKAAAGKGKRGGRGSKRQR